MVLLFATAVMAQPRREGSDLPPVLPEGEEPGWQLLAIPGLPAGAELGDVWAAPSGEVFVWANYPTPTARPTPDGDPDGERLPVGGTSRPRSSTLYRYDGARWGAALVVRGETGVALLGTDAQHLWASTIGPDGLARLYAYEGSGWTQPQLAGRYAGTLHTLAGTAEDLYVRIDRSVLHRDPDGVFRSIYEQPAGETPVRGLVSLGNDGLLMMCTDGMRVRQDGLWSDLPAGFAFADIEDAWGMRDEHGELQLYALGSNAQDNGIRMWRYTETDPATHAGSWGGLGATVIADPPGAGVPGIGCGFHAWGYTHNDVYATGVVAGEGRLMHFNGRAWARLTPPQSVGAVHGVWGTPGGTVWFSTADGRMLRFQRVNHAPDLSRAALGQGMLWPATGKLVPLTFQGITDADDDEFRIRVLGVKQTEAPMSVGWGATCPDAVIEDGWVYLRAERGDGGAGRVYDVEYVVRDRLGAESRGHAFVCAPLSPAVPCDDTAPATFSSFGPCDPLALSPGGTLAARELGGVLEVKFATPEAGRIHLGLYDVAGRCVGTVIEGPQAAGTHALRWNSGAVRPGVYFLRLRGDRVDARQRVVLVR